MHEANSWKSYLTTEEFVKLQSYAKCLALRFARATPHLRDDLISEAYIALVDCDRSYDDRRGVSFKTYLFSCVRSRIMHYWRDQVSLIRGMDQRQVDLAGTPVLEAFICGENGGEEYLLSLPSSLVPLARLLAGGCSKRDVQRLLGLSQAQVYYRIRKLRECYAGGVN